MPTDTATRDHQAWLGYLQPDGLVVSPAALVDSQVFLDKNTIELQERFKEYVSQADDSEDRTPASVENFPNLVRGFLGWPPESLHVFNDTVIAPEEIVSPLPEYGETLSPSFAFKGLKNQDGWVLLGKTLINGQNLDAVQAINGRTWGVSESRRFERLLRETGVPIGIIASKTEIRLIYAPRGENTGSITFPVQAMTEVPGRPILGAFHMLLSQYRLLAAPSEARLPALLKRSRDYQSAVSTELARQVLDALYELVRGFQSANDHTHGQLLAEILGDNPNDIYGGLLTVLMRLVFLLFAEDRGLMPTSSLYCDNYSAHGLFEKLRSDNERFPDTMDHRYGAWARLLALFRAVYQGCGHREMKMPSRKGYLFDPDRYSFLEGRTHVDKRLPIISDGVIFRILRNLLILKGERLSYRTLDVEQIGSVYETMMGFRLEVTTGQSIALKPAKSKGAPAVINLDEMLLQKSSDRLKWLLSTADQKLSGNAEEGIKSAATIEDLLVALERRIARNATPHTVPAGTMVLQPSDERRRTGSQYTPRSLTEPIVRTTLKPILERLGPRPLPSQIHDLKIADIGVGSGAFLVEVCRQLGEELIRAWHNHGEKPPIPPDEDEVLFARRKIAQRCLYGVDRNPMAVDLAKLSLWLATLAKDHPFTFLDHSIRCGDSLVGLTKMQIAEFHWEPGQPRAWGQDDIELRIEQAAKSRRELLEAEEDFVSPELKAQKLKLADDALNFVRLVGDCVIAAFFAGKNAKERQRKRDEILAHVTEFYKDWKPEMNPDSVVKELKSGEFPVMPFHWEIEFPEVFGRENGGFDGIVGNPPFAGVTTLSKSVHEGYTDYLRHSNLGAGGKCDLVAFFFRQAFRSIRQNGTFGLIATNTIGQGDTRQSGLFNICQNGGLIYSAIKRMQWPGEAAVVISIVNVIKGIYAGSIMRNGKKVDKLTSFLFTTGNDDKPLPLNQQIKSVSKGVIPYGLGFVVEDEDNRCISNKELSEVLSREPTGNQLVFDYIGGEDLNNVPNIKPIKQIVNFGDCNLSKAQETPLMLALIERKVRPERQKLNKQSGALYLKVNWWRYQYLSKEMFAAVRSLPRVLAIARVTRHVAIAFLPTGIIYNEKIVVFPTSSNCSFAVLQSRSHDYWAWFFSSTMKDDLNYTPSDCFETFPFPLDFESNSLLESAGKEYYEFRAALMIKNDEGLTKTYNRFHDRDHDGRGIEDRSPSEVVADIARLRELHASMDRAVLDAYGWTDIQPTCEFILDYEDEEDDEGNSGKKRKHKKPWRYRWPEEIHDEVLARLLALNAKRAEEERLAGEAEKKTGQDIKRTHKKAEIPGQGELFGLEP